jgi:pimeloyl-ACP methyl ester carboxylesterase
MMKTLILTMLIPLLAHTFTRAQTISNTIKPYPYRTQSVTVRDTIDIAYVDEGEGEEVLLFVHGLGSYLAAWNKNISVLSNQYRCIALDLPGYGRSTKAAYPGTMSFYSNILAEMLQALDIQEVTLVGHSMGAQISLTTALQHPRVVKGMVLAAPAGFETFTEQDAQVLKSATVPKAVAAAPAEQVKFNIGQNFYEFPNDAKFMIEDRLAMTSTEDFMTYCTVVSNNVRGMLAEPVFNSLDEIEKPVLVVYGANDALIPNRYLHKNLTTLEVAEAGVDALPNARLEIIPECGHFVPFEKADNFNTLVKAFMSGL